MEDVPLYQIKDCFAAYENALKKHPTLASLNQSYERHADVRIAEYTNVRRVLLELGHNQETEVNETLVSQIALEQHLVPQFCIARLVELKRTNYPDEQIVQRIVDEAASVDEAYLETWGHFLFSDPDAQPGIFTRMLEGCKNGLMATFNFTSKALRKTFGYQALMFLVALLWISTWASLKRDKDDQKKEDIDIAISQIAEAVRYVEYSREIPTIGGKRKSFELKSWGFPDLEEEIPRNRNQQWCYNTRNKMRAYYVELSQELYWYERGVEAFDMKLQDAFLQLGQNKKKAQEPVIFDSALLKATANTGLKGRLKDLFNLFKRTERITKEIQIFVDDTISETYQDRSATCTNLTCTFGDDYYRPEVRRIIEISQLLLGFAKFLKLADKLDEAEKRTVMKAAEIRGFARKENHRADLALTRHKNKPLCCTIGHRIRFGHDIFPRLLEENLAITRKATKDTSDIMKWDYFAGPGDNFNPSLIRRLRMKRLHEKSVSLQEYSSNLLNLTAQIEPGSPAYIEIIRKLQEKLGD